MFAFAVGRVFYFTKQKTLWLLPISELIVLAGFWADVIAYELTNHREMALARGEGLGFAALFTAFGVIFWLFPAIGAVFIYKHAARKFTVPPPAAQSL